MCYSCALHLLDRPLPPGKVAVVMTLGRCVTLSWGAPNDDGGCKIGNYIVEYYRVSLLLLPIYLETKTIRQAIYLISSKEV